MLVQRSDIAPIPVVTPDRAVSKERIHGGREVQRERQGTPQGGIVSPILANIYLHYALDLWVERVVKLRCHGNVEIVRYADDFVICVRYKDEAAWILEALKGRFGKFSLELAEDKTRIIEFGRYAGTIARKRDDKPETFNFLGFTHYVDTSRKGFFKLGRKSDNSFI